MNESERVKDDGRRVFVTKVMTRNKPFDDMSSKRDMDGRERMKRKLVL